MKKFSLIIAASAIATSANAVPTSFRLIDIEYFNAYSPTQTSIVHAGDILDLEIQFYGIELTPGQASGDVPTGSLWFDSVATGNIILNDPGLGLNWSGKIATDFIKTTYGHPDALVTYDASCYTTGSFLVGLNDVCPGVFENGTFNAISEGSPDTPFYELSFASNAGDQGMYVLQFEGLEDSVALCANPDQFLGFREYCESNGYEYVPIPAAAWLFGSALLGLAGVKRKN